jgi:hypothetical protein
MFYCARHRFVAGPGGSSLPALTLQFQTMRCPDLTLFLSKDGVSKDTSSKGRESGFTIYSFTNLPMYLSRYTILNMPLPYTFILNFAFAIKSPVFGDSKAA